MGILVSGRLLVEVLAGKRGLIVLGSHTPPKGVSEMRGASLWLTLRSLILALQNCFKSPEEGGGGRRRKNNEYFKVLVFYPDNIYVALASLGLR